MAQPVALSSPSFPHISRSYSAVIRDIGHSLNYGVWASRIATEIFDFGAFSLRFSKPYSTGSHWLRSPHLLVMLDTHVSLSNFSLWQCDLVIYRCRGPRLMSPGIHRSTAAFKNLLILSTRVLNITSYSYCCTRINTTAVDLNFYYLRPDEPNFSLPKGIFSANHAPTLFFS